MANEFVVWQKPNKKIYGVLAALSLAQVWNGTTLTAPILGYWPTYAIPFTQGSVPPNFCPPRCGVVPYYASFPTGNTTPGLYTIQPRVQTGSTPTYQTDQPIPFAGGNELTVNWNGTGCASLTTNSLLLVANATLCLPQDMYDVFGQNNIIQWSDLNATNTEDTNREWKMIIKASTKIDGFFNGGIADVLESINDQPTVQNWAATIAGCYLYSSRGTEIDSPAMFGAMRGGAKILQNQFGRFQGLYDAALDEMGEYKTGYRVAAGFSRHTPRYGSADPIPVPAGDIVTGWLRWP